MNHYLTAMQTMTDLFKIRQISLESFNRKQYAPAFEEFYQKYIFEVQDQNIVAEIGSIKTADIMSLDRMIARLRKELYGK